MADDSDWDQEWRPPRRVLPWLLSALGLLALVAGVLVVRQGLSGRTQSVPPERTATAAAGPLAPTGTVAYVAGGQVTIARPGEQPRQLTHFATPDGDPTHWGPIVWAPGAGYLAVAIGNPQVDANQVAGATGALYVVDVRTGNATLVTSGAATSVGVAIGPATYDWEDAARLLFTAGGKVYAYDVRAGSAAPLQGLNSTTVLDLAVRGHALYYASSTAAGGPLSALPASLRRFDLDTHADALVTDLGTVLMQVTGCDVTGCMAAAGVAATLPAWDVSLDGRALAFERVTGLSADRTHADVAFFFASAAPAPATPGGGQQPLFGTPTAIFAGVAHETPAGMPNACCYLRFSPDGRALALTSGYAMPAAFGPYLLYPRMSPTAYQTGFPWAFGPAAWRPDSRAFSLTTHRASAPTTTVLTFGDQQTAVLAQGGYDAAYAPAV
jgi:hypothetical protein